MALGWESLPEALLDSILDNLVPIADCIRFSAVCRAWRCVAVENFRQIRRSSRYGRLQQQQLPLLMLPSKNSRRQRRSLYSVTQTRVFDFQLPVPYNVRFCGSSHGWLIVVDDAFKVTLFNPFSGEIISLPPIRRLAFEKRFREEISEIISKGEEYERQLREEYGEEVNIEEEEEEDDDDEEEEDVEEYMEEEEDGGEDDVKEEAIEGRSEYSILKGVLSADPSVNPKEYVLMVIYGLEQRLAFIKPDDKEWTYLDGRTCCFEDHDKTDSPPPVSLLWHMTDIIFYKQRFYALYCMGQLLSCHIDTSTGFKVKKITPQDGLGPTFGKAYLVESLEGGDILRVLRRYGKNKMTTGFKIYRLADGYGDPEWTEVKSLGDFALFLGENHSISVSASDYPGCEPNSIYFCGDHIRCSHRRRKDPYDIGVFNLENGRVVESYRGDAIQWSMPPPIWILPTFM